MLLQPVSSIMIFTLVEKFEYLVYLAGELMHTVSKERNSVTHPDYSNCLKSEIFLIVRIPFVEGNFIIFS